MGLRNAFRRHQSQSKRSRIMREPYLGILKVVNDSKIEKRVSRAINKTAEDVADCCMKAGGESRYRRVQKGGRSTDQVELPESRLPQEATSRYRLDSRLLTVEDSSLMTTDPVSEA